MQRAMKVLPYFKVPIIVFFGILIYLVLAYLVHLQFIAIVLALVMTVLGSYELFKESYESVREKHFALDYIAMLAIILSIITREYVVAMVIAVMTSTGRTLEDYGVSLAKNSLTKLANRIPQDVTMWEDDHPGGKMKIAKVAVGQKIYVRKGEVIPLDGILVSQNGETDESSLTGEPYMIEKIEGDVLRSGTVNVGEPIVITVTQPEAQSTYKKIITMVQSAQTEKAPLVRLADQYSTYFTLITAVIAVVAFVWHHDLYHVLAVLVIATPCPLILATPIALMGGMNASAKQRIIVKKLASLESLAKIQAIIFDKTGTITLGKPTITAIDRKDQSFSEHDILAIAEAIERSSLHPLAKAIVAKAQHEKVPTLHAVGIKETIGSGISGEVNGKRYTVARLANAQGMQIGLSQEDRLIAVFSLEDEIKPESKKIIQHLKEHGLELQIFTGDKRENAEKVASQLGKDVTIRAECTPEDKKLGLEQLRNAGKVMAMVGDGINDAPALAYADVGMVFSNQEHTAASEAADIVFLGGDFGLVHQAITIAQNTIHIAMQSILFGIGASIVGMLLASAGLIPPVVGAILQEVIDVAVIINALRASRVSS